METQDKDLKNLDTNDVQAEIIAASAEVPQDIWKAIEAVKPFLPRQTEPVFMTSYTGTSGVL
jgi:hypothetical protein